jgi:hypothetical protein
MHHWSTEEEMESEEYTDGTQSDEAVPLQSERECILWVLAAFRDGDHKEGWRSKNRCKKREARCTKASVI